jgi:hypothetical protein
MYIVKYSLLAVLLFVIPSLAVEYKPLFSKELLQKAEPEARARMQALDDENRRRWEKDQPSSEPSVARTPEKVVYRYVDKNGKVQFSENPVGDASIAIEVQTRAPTEQSLLEHAQNQQAQREILDDFAERQKIRDRQANAEAAASAKRRQHTQECETLVLELRDYQRGGLAYYELDEKGNRRYFEEWEVQAEITKLEATYRQNCGEIPREGSR